MKKTDKNNMKAVQVWFLLTLFCPHFEAGVFLCSPLNKILENIIILKWKEIYIRIAQGSYKFHSNIEIMYHKILNSHFCKQHLLIKPCCTLIDLNVTKCHMNRNIKFPHFLGKDRATIFNLL